MSLFDLVMSLFLNLLLMWGAVIIHVAAQHMLGIRPA